MHVRVLVLAYVDQLATLRARSMHNLLTVHYQISDILDHKVHVCMRIRVIFELCNHQGELLSCPIVRPTGWHGLAPHVLRINYLLVA